MWVAVAVVGNVYLLLFLFLYTKTVWGRVPDTKSYFRHYWIYRTCFSHMMPHFLFIESQMIHSIPSVSELCHLCHFINQGSSLEAGPGVCTGICHVGSLCFSHSRGTKDRCTHCNNVLNVLRVVCRSPPKEEAQDFRKPGSQSTEDQKPGSFWKTFKM